MNNNIKLKKKNLESINFITKLNKKLGIDGFKIILGIYFLFSFIEIYSIKYYFGEIPNSKNIIPKQKIKDNYHYIKYSFIYGSICLPILIFFFDLIYKNGKLWDILFGKDYPKHLISSSEKRKTNKFIKYPINTYSSCFLFNIGNYMILSSSDAKIKIVSMWFGIIMNILGIASCSWWASSKIQTRKMDNLLMEIHLLYLSLSYIALIYEEYTNLINLFVIVIATLRYQYINNARIVILFLLENISSMYLCIKYQNVGNEFLFYLGTLCILIGFYCKLNDYVYNYKYGTGLFHIFAPLSILLHYEWSQTVIE